MIAKIFVRQKVNVDSPFDYIVEEKKVPDLFSLVAVPFRNRKAQGVVFKLAVNSNFASKKIIRLISKSTIFTPLQFKLASAMSELYAASFAKTIFSFLPKMNLEDLKCLGSKVVLKRNKKSVKRLIIASKDERLEFYCQSLGRKKTNLNQNLLVFPTVHDIDRAVLKLKKYLPSQKILAWNSSLSSSQKARIWQGLIAGENLTIVGTRHALFLPFTSFARSTSMIQQILPIKKTSRRIIVHFR